MQFVDIISIDHKSKQFAPKLLIASLLYLMIGGKDIMAAFNFDYNQMIEIFLINKEFPVPGYMSIQNNEFIKSNNSQNPENVVFYNQIIESFLIEEFG